MTDISTDRWQLPDGVDELLPDAAWRVEHLRRRIVDCCHAWGFELVMPPMIEYLDSLLTGTGETMDLQTFKLVDQQNGRTLGIRADMTPQVARLDAHALRSHTPNRLFYTGTVLRARTDGFGGNRSPLQFGAELFGHAGSESDIEIIRLMLATLGEAGYQQNDLLLDIGHVGVYRGLTESLDLSNDSRAQLFSAVQNGSLPDVKAIAGSMSDSNQSDVSALLEQLMTLRGDESIVERARTAFSNAPDRVQQSLDSLQAVIEGVKRTHPGIKVNIDLAELRGYSYHTGVLFAAYTHDGVELSRGGRYDAVGAAFGHARPATGFSGDLKKLAGDAASTSESASGIFVAADDVTDAWSEIVKLRSEGYRVVTQLGGNEQTAQMLNCDRQLVRQGDQWLVAAVAD